MSVSLLKMKLVVRYLQNMCYNQMHNWYKCLLYVLQPVLIKKKEEQTQREAIMKQVPDGSFFIYTAQVEQLYKINIPKNSLTL